MSSSTITVKPRRKTAQSPPPTAQSTNQNKGTVLLRNPLPRYSFDQKSRTGKSKNEKKISAESDSNKDATDDNLTNAEKLQNSSVSSSLSNITEPVTVCKLVASFPQNSIGVETLSETSFVSKPENCETGLKDKPVNKVGPISKTLTHSVSDSVISVQNNSENGASSQQTGTHNQETNVLDCDSGGNQSTSTGTLSEEQCKCSEKIKHLEEEKQLLKNQLEVQLQVHVLT
jgi:hypothetical protein